MPTEFWVDPANQDDEKTPIYESVPVTKDIAFVGMRVIRGIDWKFEDQDGGVGGVGSIKSIENETSYSNNYWCTVTWDSGRTDGYRLGPEHHDLYVHIS